MTGRAGPGPAPSRRALLAGLGLGAGLGGLGGLAGCASEGEPAPGTTLPPDVVSTRAAAAAPRDLAGGAAGFFGPGYVPERRGATGLARARIMPSDDPRFKQFVRVSLPAAAKEAPNTPAIYGDGPTYGGTQLFLRMKEYPKVEYYLRYYVRFGSQFEFTKGGLLPGFYGQIVKGLERTDTDRDGLATRFMWRKQGAGAVCANTAWPDHPRDVVGKNTWTWPTGRWVCVEQGVRLNTLGFAQGLLLVWIDGKRMVQMHGFNPRISTKLRLGGVLFHAAFGPGDRSAAPEDDQTIDFAAFATGRTRIGELPKPSVG